VIRYVQGAFIVCFVDERLARYLYFNPSERCIYAVRSTAVYRLLSLVSTLLLMGGVLCLANAKIYFQETFDDSYADRWVPSNWKKSSGDAGVFKHTAGPFFGDAQDSKGLQTSQDAKFYAISAKFPHSFSNEGKDLIVQYDVRFPQKIDCGGGYVKVAGGSLDQANFGGDTPYSIMFGPDICGSSTKKTHVILHSEKKNDNLLIKKNIPAETDQLTHTYTLILHPDNTYQVNIDGSKKESGSLEEDWDFLPPKKVKDPSLSKPKDWVDDAQMDDPSDLKPADYDSVPKTIPDPEAEKPEDWDDDADGAWEPPSIPNPEFKGEWKPKRIPNPAYKGPWVHPEIENPDYTPDPNLYRFKDLGSIGIDVWQVKAGTIFDNIIVTDSLKEAEDFQAAHHGKHKDAEKAAFDAEEKAKQEKESAERAKAEEARKASEADDEEEDEDAGHDEL